MAIYPKRNLSKLGLAKYIRRYLLRGLEINRPNEVWAKYQFDVLGKNFTFGENGP